GEELQQRIGRDAEHLRVVADEPAQESALGKVRIIAALEGLDLHRAHVQALRHLHAGEALAFALRGKGGTERALALARDVVAGLVHGDQCFSSSSSCGESGKRRRICWRKLCSAGLSLVARAIFTPRTRPSSGGALSWRM